MAIMDILSLQEETVASVKGRSVFEWPLPALSVRRIYVRRNSGSRRATTPMTSAKGR
jgi:hypothetical protein